MRKSLPIIRKATVRVLTPCRRGRGAPVRVTHKVPRVVVPVPIAADDFVIQDEAGFPVQDETGSSVIDNT